MKNIILDKATVTIPFNDFNEIVEGEIEIQKQYAVLHKGVNDILLDPTRTEGMNRAFKVAREGATPDETAIKILRAYIEGLEGK